MSAKTSDSEAPRKSGRIGKPKVRTGCITCKFRRIKCDENKPSCLRCTSTGRQCDGYALPAKADGLRKKGQLPSISVVFKFTNSNPIPPRVVGYPNSTPDELRSLEFFRCKTAKKLSTWLAESFWEYQLPQTGYYEPSIRHSMIAMASIHEEMEVYESRGLDPQPFSLSDARKRYAAHHTQLAMSELSKILFERPEAADIALINCILFVLLDYMVGNFSAAVLHLYNGNEILTKWRTKQSNPVKQDSLEDNITQLFHQLSFQTSQSMADDEDRLWQFHIDDIKQCSFPDLYTARKSIDFLTKDGLRIVRELALLSLSNCDKNTARTEIESHRARLERWLLKFGNLIASMKGFHDEQYIGELSIMHTTATIWLELGVSFDQSEPVDRLFEAINRAEAQHHRICTHYHDHLSTHLAFEESIAPPMYFMAAKLHQPDLKPNNVAVLVLRKSRASGRSFSVDSSVQVIEDRAGPDGKRVLEIQLDTMTKQVDLSYLPGPGQEGGTWRVTTNGSDD